MKLALIGKKLGHSFSVEIWKNIWAKDNINGSFEIIETDDISNIRHIIDNKRLDGMTVTIPYKKEVMSYLQEISTEAMAIGAVNTIKKIGDKLCGYNTDVYGYQQLFLHACEQSNITNNNLNILICGYGGAAKAVIYAHKNMGHNITLLRRENTSEIESITYEKVRKQTLSDFDVIVNTTPLGMYPNIGSYPLIPYSSIKENCIAIDLVYNPENTEFMKHCRKYGANTFNGFLMLQKQAEKFYEILNTSH